MIYPLSHDSKRLRLKQRWSKKLLSILAIRCNGELTETELGSLIVANHISWVDIFVINAVHPVAFVAKADVRQWPLAGWLAAKTDTVFLRRGSRGHARIVNAEIDALLAAGKDVAVFPEGTTSDGTRLLGFHAALLQPAIESGRPVQPLAIRYENPDGSLSLAPAYVGETSLARSLCAILACRSLVARLHAPPPIMPVTHKRRELALAAHDAIAVSLGLPRASNRPGTPAGPPDAPRSDDAPTGTPNPAPADWARHAGQAQTSAR